MAVRVSERNEINGIWILMGRIISDTPVNLYTIAYLYQRIIDPFTRQLLRNPIPEGLGRKQVLYNAMLSGIRADHRDKGNEFSSTMT